MTVGLIIASIGLVFFFISGSLPDWLQPEACAVTTVLLALLVWRIFILGVGLKDTGRKTLFLSLPLVFTLLALGLSFETWFNWYLYQPSFREPMLSFSLIGTAAAGVIYVFTYALIPQDARR